MKVTDLFYKQIGISRFPYLLIGSILLIIKYNLDRLIAFAFDKQWYFYDYFYSIESFFNSGYTVDEVNFALAMFFTALPFIIVGTILTLKRLRDAGLPGWLVSFFFLPYINLLTFSILCALPTKQTQNSDGERPTFLKRFIPSSAIGSALMGIAVSVGFSVLLSLVSIEFFTEYGWGLFIGIPFFSGLASVLISSYHHPVSFSKSIVLALLTVAVFSAALLAFAIEGIICLAMAAPIGITISILGGIIGFYIQKNFHKPQIAPAGNLLLFIPLLMFAEKVYEKESILYPLQTSIVVEAEPQEVWKHLVGFTKISPPKEIIFKAGIAYPTHATITGTGVDAVRECHFTTGAFVEPITVWNEPYHLAFDVLAQPVPMTELSFYKNLETEHLHGYFHSQKGEFRLTRLPSGFTQLTGTTWYQNSLWPGFYWKLWSDEILHKIHFRVLNHIKAESELRVKHTQK